MGDLSPKLQQLIQLCEGKKFPLSHPSFVAVCNVLRKTQSFHVGVDQRDRIVKAVCECFDISQEKLLSSTYGISHIDPETFSRYHRGNHNAEKAEAALDALIPSTGYFRHYIDYTRNSEPPLAYHFWCAVIGVAATINRRVYLPWGIFNYYPATGTILVGPSGVKKTSAADVIVGILRDLSLIEVYAEKITPEAMIEALKGENATGLIYAPEMATLINRKKYNEGFTELLTRWMDCPDKWVSSTIMRSKVTLYNLGISSIVVSTPDWLMDNLPEGTFGGGFIARFILCVQDDSARVVTKPQPPDPSEYHRIKMELAYMHQFQGEMSLPERVYARHDAWYHSHKEATHHPSHELLGTYYQRKQAHVLRLAMCLHLATHYDTDDPMGICLDCHDRAVAILDWNEQFLPNLFDQLFKTSTGLEQAEVLKAIVTSGGAISHTALLRKLQHRFDSGRIKTLTGSLKEAGQVREENGMLGHMYVLEVQNGT